MGFPGIDPMNWKSADQYHHNQINNLQNKNPRPLMEAGN